MRFVACTPEERSDQRTRLRVPDGGHLLVSVGRLVPRKGVDVLVKAVQLLAAEHCPVVLAIAGVGRDEGRLRRLAGGAANVHFLGRVDDEAKVALLGAADVFVQPCRSRWGGFEQEGFGIVFLEAAACGTPAVAGRSGGSFEAVEHGVTGLVVDEPHEPVAVARALRELLADDVARMAMGAAARARAEASFDYDVLARQLALGLAQAMSGARTHPDRTPRRH
jgi:phosphatidylinositol alpha-1,6-mannosyltransferase